jgi:hypothetical protein
VKALKLYRRSSDPRAVLEGHPVSVEISIHILVIAINLIVGGRLLRLGAVRRAWPELLLGASLTFDGIEWLFWMLAFYTPLAETPLADPLAAACRGGIVVTMLFLLLFVRTVFRPTAKWALAFALSISFIIATGFAVGLYLGDWRGFASDRIWLWLELGGTQLAYCWCFAEASSYYRNMRKRCAHGLVDPVVTNRVLLWSCYAASGMITELLYMTGAAIARSDGSYPFILDAVMIVTTIAGSTSILLAFFPPAAYLRWVARNATPATDPRKTTTAH